MKLRGGKCFAATVIIFLIFSPVALAQKQPPDEKTKVLCNQGLMKMYRDILKLKNKYEELVDFNKDALSKNSRGLYKIVYQYGEDAPLKRDKRETPYAFGITIDGMDEVPFPRKQGAFDYEFPALRLRISGYQKKRLLRTQYNILPLIQEYRVLISRHEQKYLPLRLYLETIKDVYYLGEDIEFKVMLKNVSQHHMLVRNLNKETLFFLVNNKVWGTEPLEVTRGGEKILKAGKSIQMRFRGENFRRPQEVEIQAVYGMTVRGVDPKGILKIKIIAGESRPNAAEGG